MTPARAREIARQVAVARADRTDFTTYDDVTTISDAYAVQDALAELEGDVGGWKISWNRPELQANFGVVAPGGARVLKRLIRPDGATLFAPDHAQPMLEPEIAAVLASDIPMDATSAEAVAPHVAYLVPAFEVLDRRQVATRDGVQIIAQGVFNAGAVIGTPAGTQIGPTTVEIGGEVHLDGVLAAPEPPLEALAYLVRLFGARGVQLRQGDVVLCGSHTPLLPIARGQSARMAVAGLGEVALDMV